MRCDQFMGLNPWASTLVEGQQVLVATDETIRTHRDGRKETLEPCPVFASTVRKEESGEFYPGMFDQEYPLHKYTLPDGQVCIEKVQASPHSSGPVFFLALQDEIGNWIPESLWTEEEIANA